MDPTHISAEDIQDLRDAFMKIDINNDGFISKDELNELFRAANLPLPGYKVREIVQDLTCSSHTLTFDQFTQVSQRSKVTTLPSHRG
uniref:plastin-2-like n=1 Tax=Solea senegalensis TaxID=28829 RepID=UPI001CD89CDA|nr:plastin-2-like [Solea senegalensis]